MKNCRKTTAKHYRFLLHEIPSKDLKMEFPNFYQFMQVYQSDLLAKMTDIYENKFEENASKYCLDENVSKAITRHAINACKYKRSLSDVVDKIKFDWGVKISDASVTDDPCLEHAENPKSIEIKYPIFKEVIIEGSKFAQVQKWDTIELYFDKSNSLEKCKLLNKIHLYYYNNSLRIYAIGSY